MCAFLMYVATDFVLSSWKMHEGPWKRRGLEGNVGGSEMSMDFSALMLISQKFKFLSQDH